MCERDLGLALVPLAVAVLFHRFFHAAAGRVDQRQHADVIPVQRHTLRQASAFAFPFQAGLTCIMRLSGL